MKSAKELKSRVEEIEKRISELRKHQESLCEEVKNKEGMPFELKFKVWAVCAKDKLHVCHISSEKFPHTKKLLIKEGYTPNQQINIFQRWGFKFNLVTSGLLEGEEKEEILCVMKELFDANVGSISCMK